MVTEDVRSVREVGVKVLSDHADAVEGHACMCMPVECTSVCVKGAVSASLECSGVVKTDGSFATVCVDGLAGDAGESRRDEVPGVDACMAVLVLPGG